MKNIPLILIFLIGCKPVENKKSLYNDKDLVRDKQVTVSKNFMFSLCLNAVNYEYNINMENKHGKYDGSTEIYLIDTLLSVDIEESKVFISNLFR
jgi:hypothetical protein